MASNGSASTTLTLPGYEAQPADSGVAHSHAKLQNVELALSVTAKRLPCQTEAATWAYRCACTFQMIRVDNGKLSYAMRSQKRAVPLGSSAFPIANDRIQEAMTGLLNLLNNESNVRNTLTEQLTSVSFASSWNETDCVVTLHYRALVDEKRWGAQATGICRQLCLSKLTGRSKGRVFTVGSGKDTLSDTVWLHRSGESFTASLERVGNGDIKVCYEKPETAFFHPNGRVMLEALEWLISRLHTVQRDHPCHMLEMYCGCGAHTVAIASTGLLESILAVELDQRLVDACVANCSRNGCLEEGSVTAGNTPVQVIKGDAATWALDSRRARQRQPSSSTKNNAKYFERDYHVLLVDPPRMGLDDAVCRMAIEGTFQHILYISCGRQALQRDLFILRDHFQAVDCTLLDLFPRTDSVESLVHLVRRGT